MNCNKIKKIMTKYFQEKDKYDGAITVGVFERHDNRTHFRVETDGNDYELCAYNDGATFMRLGSVTAGAGSWATLDGQPALIVDDVPFMPFETLMDNPKLGKHIMFAINENEDVLE